MVRKIALTALIVVAIPLFAAETKKRVSSKKSAKPASVAKAPAVTTPVVVKLPVQKCFACETKLRKRVAVMPVKVGTLATELQMTPQAVAAKVRDELESTLANQDGIVVVNRSELPDVLAEQQLSDTAVANKELAPLHGKVIPAQLVLSPTVSSIDVNESASRESNSTAERYVKAAMEKEQEAQKLQAEARQRASDQENSAPAHAFQTVCNYPVWGCSTEECRSRMQRLQDACEQNNRTMQEYAERRAEQRQREGQQEVDSLRNRARSLMEEAAQLRRQADVESQTNVTESRTTTVTASVVWRAIDTSTAAVMASGGESGIANRLERGVSQTSAFHSSSSSDSRRYDAVVNEAVSHVVDNVARAVKEKLATEPFRAKVVRADGSGIVINAGANSGMAVGDTFGVRKKREVLTDPDTGLPLESPGAPIGVIRVSEVHEKTSFAQVIETAGPVERGDELEWIGVYELVTPQQPGATQQ